MEPMPKASLDQMLATIPAQALDQTVTDKHLAEIAKMLTNWKFISPYLGISEAEVEAIEEENKTSDERRLAMLRRWRSKYCQTATYKNLAKVFSDSANKADMVEVICQLLTPSSFVMDQPQGNQITNTAFPSSANVSTDTEEPPQSSTAYCTPNHHDETTSQLPTNIYSKVKSEPPLAAQLENLTFNKDLSVETHDIQSEFHKLFHKVRLYLTGKGVTVREFVYFLKDIPGYSRRSLFELEIQELLQQEDLIAVFEIVERRCSWFNHSVLCDIIDMYCEEDKKIKKAYQQYYTHLKKYCKHRAKSVPRKNAFGIGGLNDRVMIMKIDRKWEDIEVQELEEVVYNLARILNVKRHALHLRCVENGCVQLTLMVPSYIPDEVFPLNHMQEVALREMGVVSLQCDDDSCHFSCQQSIKYKKPFPPPGGVQYLSTTVDASI